MSFNRRYYEERLARNRALAENSRDPAIRTIHLHYVRLYERMLESAGTEMADLSH